MQRRIISVALPLFCALALSGCGLPLLAGMTLVELSTAGSVISTAATGKGLSEHAMDVATGRDCRIIDSMVRADRKLCERRNSPALNKDWKGLASIDGEPYTALPILDPGSEARSAKGG
ncbi:MAG: hypothetical protein IMF08_10640 [Proteobacteria bacterium]|nr:hypothetical protein [Pseudomonadota bacterium]MCK4867022.1 hypothetical protein [Alphaproteobacteria bacterium]